MPSNGRSNSSRGASVLRKLFGQGATQFRNLLSRAELPFDVIARLSELKFPGYTSFESGLPSAFYYFVPGSNYCGGRLHGSDPLAMGHATSVDGFGLNFGCPLRLRRSLEILFLLSHAEQKECLEGLRATTKHLATVEELLWLDLWKPSRLTSRSEQQSGRTHDWIVTVDNVVIRQECKLIPFDWTRSTDGLEFDGETGFLLSKASEQLPKPPESDVLNVVTITGISRLDCQLRGLIKNELDSFPSIDVLVFRNYTNDTAFYSLDQTKISAVKELIGPQHALPFQPAYHVVFHRAETERRRVAHATSGKTRVPNSTGLLWSGLYQTPPDKTFPVPREPYRLELDGRASDGEPQFRVITPRL